MNRKSKINAIISIVANKDQEKDIIEFIELDSNNIEIRKEVVEFSTLNNPTKLTIGVRSESYESVKSGLINLKKQLSK